MRPVVNILTLIDWVASPTCLTFMIGLLLIHMYNAFKKKDSEVVLPPGPWAWPIIGNLVHLQRSPHEKLRNYAQKYGPVMRISLGSIPAVVVSTSEAAREFLKTHDATFSSRPASESFRILSNGTGMVLVGPHGSLWSQARKILVSEVLSPKKVESFRVAREEEFSWILQYIWNKSRDGTNVVDVTAAMDDLFSNFTWRLIAGKTYATGDFPCLLGSGDDFRGLLDAGLEAFQVSNISDFIGFLTPFDLIGSKRRIKVLTHKLDQIFSHIVDEQLAELHNGNLHNKSFLHVLLEEAQREGSSLSMQNIKVIVMETYVGARETNASTMNSAMCELLRHREKMRKLEEEIESVCKENGGLHEVSLNKMRYLHCVLKETIRLHPSVLMGVPHLSHKNVNVCGYHIHENSWVIFNLWAIGRDPKVWEDPEEFKPERFLDENKDSMIDISGLLDMKMLPFGAGRRGCPGVNMALASLKLCLAGLLYAFDWVMEEEEIGSGGKDKHLMVIPKLKHPTRLSPGIAP